MKNDDPFPASPNVPGQEKSRSAYSKLNDLDQSPWFGDYLELREEKEEDGKPLWSWRLAVYIAWASLPSKRRWPSTQEELASKVLGLKSDRVIRKWRSKNPAIDDRVARLSGEMLFKHRVDVLNALVEVATSPDPRAHSDRKLFLEMTGDYKASRSVTVSGEEDGPPVVFSVEKAIEDMDEEALDNFIKNLETTISIGDVGEGEEEKGSIE